MYQIKIIFETCFKILNLSISLFGYHITFWQVFMFVIVGSLLLWLIFGILK